MLYNLAPVQTFILVKTHNQDIFEILSLLNLMQIYNSYVVELHNYKIKNKSSVNGLYNYVFKYFQAHLSHS